MKFKLSDEEKHPVAAGLIALAAVAVVVGLGAGIFAIVASVAMGGGGSSATAGTTAAGPSLYLPSPQPTKGATGPLITLAPQPSDAPPVSTAPAPSPSKSAKAKAITLSASPAKVSPMGRIDLTGVYPEGEGAVLQVQRKEGGSWSDFPVTIGVSGGQFSTYVETGRVGKHKWRVRDGDAGESSNAVTITVK